MLRLTRQRREILAEKFGDLANLAVGALVFGQAVTEDQFSLLLGVAGSTVWALLTAATYLLLGDGQ
jgi:hypothetical protein